ncbi:MAG: endonuclease/exonuclease/phosphatase family protein [Pyrinomonadaceae bacterium]
MFLFRIATYNIHKCVGLDRRFSPDRILKVLKMLDADIIGLQEVVAVNSNDKRENQAQYFADELGYNVCFGKNRLHNGSAYGNAILSRLEIGNFKNFDITINKREPRGCLVAKLKTPNNRHLTFFNVHLGTSYFERRKQIHRLLNQNVMSYAMQNAPRIIAGDFNEWTKGLTTKLMKSNFYALEPKQILGKRRTYPGIAPVLHLDHIYYDGAISLEKSYLKRNRTSLIASDHLPLVAEFLF